MSQYSEMMGSFIRTGNYPLEANYIFNTEEELINFYDEPLNKTTLHTGLFKIVVNDNEPALYWVVPNENDDLYFEKLVDYKTIQDVQELESKLELEIKDRTLADNAIWGTTDPTEINLDLNTILKLSEAILDIRDTLDDHELKLSDLKDDIKIVVGTEEDVIADYLATLDYKNLTEISETLNHFLNTIDDDEEQINTLPEIQEFLRGFDYKHNLYLVLVDLWNAIEGDPTPNTLFRTLRGILDFVEALSSYTKNRMDNIQTEIDLTQVGVGLSGDGAYNADLETYYLKNATSVMNALKILDSLINDALSNCRLVAEETNTVKVNLVREVDKTIISADVKLSPEVGNDILAKGDGLYHNIDSEYENGILTIKVNGNIRLQHVLGLSSIVEDGYYDTSTESIKIIFKLHDGNKQIVTIPVTALISEWTVDNSISSKVVELTKERVTADGADKLSADVRISTNKYNILEKDANTLLVRGVADNIVYDGDVTVKSKLDEIVNHETNLDTSVLELKDNLRDEILRATKAEEDIQDALDNEILRSTEKDNDLTTALSNEVSRATDAEKVLTDNLTDEITRSTEEDRRLDKAISDEVIRAKAAEHELQDGIDANKTYIEHVEEKVTDNTDNILALDTKVSDLKDSLTEEINRAKLAELSLSNNIGDEQQRATDAENALDTKITNLTTSLNLEITRSTLRDTELDDKINAESGRATAKELELENSIATEKQRAEDAEAGLDHKIDDLKDYIDTNYGNDHDLTVRVTTLEKDLTDEITRSTNKDVELTDAIALEKTRATDAETLLDHRIDDTNTALETEVNRAKDAEKVLTDNLNAEVTRATAKEDLLQTDLNKVKTDLDTEIARASNAETALSNRLDTVSTDLTNEVTRAKSAEKDIKDSLDAEITRSVNKDTELENAINAVSKANTLSEEDTSSIDMHVVKTADGTTVSADVKLSDNPGNIILSLQGGLYTNVDVTYDAVSNKLSFFNGLNTKELLLSQGSIIDNLAYDKTTESLIIYYTDALNNAKEVTVNLADLITEWTVENDTNTLVTLTKSEHKVNGLDTLSADLKLSNVDGLLLLNIDGRLYASNNSTNIIYKNSTVHIELLNLIDSVNQYKTELDTLSQTVLDEIKRSTDKDTELTDSLKTLDDNLKAEINRAKLEELDLSNRITNTNTDVSNLANKLTAEIERSTNVDTLLLKDLTDEVNRAKLKETEIINALNGEVDRAKAAEAAVDHRVDDTNTALENEVNRAIAAENVLTNSVNSLTEKTSELNDTIKDEVNRAKNAEQGLSSDITLLRADMVAADGSLETKIGVEKQRAESAESALDTKIETVKENIETNISTKISTLLDTLNNEITRSTTEDSTIKDNLTTVTTSLNTEIGRATAAENLLAERISNLKDALDTNSASDTAIKEAVDNLKLADITLLNNIDNVDDRVDTVVDNLNKEIIRAKESEGEIKTSLDAEIQRSTDKDDLLLRDLTTETLRASTKESELSTAIANEETRARAAETGLDTKISAVQTVITETINVRIDTLQDNLNNEITRSTTKDNNLTDQVNLLGLDIKSEESRAKLAELELSGNLDVEVSRAKAKEELLDHRIDDLQKDLNDKLDEINNSEGDISSDIDDLNALLTATNNKLNAEITRSTTADTDLDTAIKAEVTRATTAEATISKEISDVINKCIVEGATTAEEAYALLVKLGADYSTVEAIGKTLKAFLENKDLTDTTINRWLEIESFLTGITDTDTLTGLLEQVSNNASSDVIDLRAELTTEVTRAKAAEKTLEDSIVAEKTRAENAEKDLSDSIDDNTTYILNVETKVTTNTTAISDLNKSLNTTNTDLLKEVNRALLAEQGLSNSITNLATTVSTNNTDVLNKINTEKARAEGIESTLDTKIDNTKTGLEASITNVQTNLDNEVNRAKEQETGLRTDLTAETTRATLKEAELELLITNNSKSITVSAEDTNSINTTVNKTADGTIISSDVILSDNPGNIIQSISSGLYATVDVDYNEATNKISFFNGTTTKELLLSVGSIIDTLVYDKTTESLILSYTNAQHTTSTVSVNLADIITDWGVVNNTNSLVTLTKSEHKVNGIDTLSAELNLSNKSGQLILNIDGYLYASNNSTDIVYKNSTIHLELEKLIASVNQALADITKLQEDLSDEVTRAIDAEKELGTNVNKVITDLGTEISRATTKETELNSAITAEKTRAEAAESNLKTAIEAVLTVVTETVSNKIDTLQTNLNAEVSRSTQRDSEISDKVSDLDSTLKAQVTALGTTNSEVTALKTSLSNVSDKLQEEITRATNADGTLTSAINLETTRATGIEDDLRHDLDLHTASFNNPHQVTAALVNAYTRSEVDTLINGIKTNNNTSNDTINGSILDLNTDLTVHVNKTDNPHNVTATLIGLGKVDNTTDLEKPISVAVQGALNDINISVSKKAEQQSLLDHIFDHTNPHNVTKEQIGLGNVDNTSDVNKPISLATLMALDKKSDLGHQHTMNDIADLENLPIVKGFVETLSELPEDAAGGDKYILTTKVGTGATRYTCCEFNGADGTWGLKILTTGGIACNVDGDVWKLNSTGLERIMDVSDYSYFYNKIYDETKDLIEDIDWEEDDTKDTNGLIRLKITYKTKYGDPNEPEVTNPYKNKAVKYIDIDKARFLSQAWTKLALQEDIDNGYATKLGEPLLVMVFTTGDHVTISLANALNIYDPVDTPSIDMSVSDWTGNPSTSYKVSADVRLAATKDKEDAISLHILNSTEKGLYSLLHTSNTNSISLNPATGANGTLKTLTANLNINNTLNDSSDVKLTIDASGLSAKFVWGEYE